MFNHLDIGPSQLVANWKVSSPEAEKPDAMKDLANPAEV